MIPHIVLLISRLLNIVQKCFCTPDGAMDPTFQIKYVPAFQHVCSRRYYSNNLGCIFFGTPCIYAKYIYGNMGVKRCIRTSAMQTNVIKQLLNRFNSLKCRNSDFQDFPLYFFRFPLYNVRLLCYGCVAPRKKCQY